MIIITGLKGTEKDRNYINQYDRDRKHFSRIMKKNKNCFKSVPMSKFKILQLKNNTTKNLKNATVENLVTENFVTEKNLKEKMPSSIEKSRLASGYLRKMVELKKNKKKLELEELKKEVLEKFRSRRELAFFCNEMERVIYRLFHSKAPVKNESIYMKKLKTEEKEEMRKHSISKFNANVFPTARFGRYYYLQCPISQLHADWLNSHRKVSRMTIYRNLDKNVKPMKKTPHLQCYCKECSDLESKGRALFHEHMPGPLAMPDILWNKHGANTPHTSMDTEKGIYSTQVFGSSPK